MSSSRPYAQVDVFTSTPYYGNPTAVVFDAEDISDEAMARFADWTNLSETTFFLPPSSKEADYRLRIFTPNEELPFAGHPTLGSAHAWLEAGNEPKTPGRIVQECGMGLVEIHQDGEVLRFRAPDRLRTGPLEPALVDRIARALRLNRDDIIGHQWADNGPGWVAVQLRTAQEVLNIEPDRDEIRDLRLGVIGAYPSGSSHDFEVRAFVEPVGVPEDPVTGSVNASIAQWLIEAGIAPDNYTVSQGTRVGRSGTVSIAKQDNAIWVGGTSVTCIRGEVTI